MSSTGNSSKRSSNVCLLWWFILQDWSDFGSVLQTWWQMLSGFWMGSNLTFKRLFSSIISTITCTTTRAILLFSQMPKCTFCIVCFTEKDEKEESNGHTQWMRKLKFTNIKRNTFFNLDRMQITPSLINGLSEIRLEIFAKDNNWNQISRVPICYLVQALF